MRCVSSHLLPIFDFAFIGFSSAWHICHQTWTSFLHHIFFLLHLPFSNLVFCVLFAQMSFLNINPSDIFSTLHLHLLNFLLFFPPICHFFLSLSRLQCTPQCGHMTLQRSVNWEGIKHSNRADWSSCSGLRVKWRCKSSSAERLLIQVKNSLSDQKWGWGCHTPVAVNRPALSIFRLTFSKLPWAGQYILDHEITEKRKHLLEIKR